jgi:hypothetical protein
VFDHPSDLSIPISLDLSIRDVNCVFAAKINKKMKINIVISVEVFSMIVITSLAG